MADEDAKTIKPNDLITAKLAEYNVLKNELQYRAEFQHRILQLHVTALTAIVAAFFLNADTITTEAKHLLVYLIPIESLLFGFHYFNHSARIFFIAGYLYKIEQYINDKLKDSALMRWEVELRARESESGIWKPAISRSKGKKRKRANDVRSILLVDRPTFWILDVPATIAVVLAAGRLLLSIPLVQDWAGISPDLRKSMFAPSDELSIYIQAGFLLAIVAFANVFYKFRIRLGNAQRGPLTKDLWNDVEALVHEWDTHKKRKGNEQ